MTEEQLIDITADPLALFGAWFAAAKAKEPADANAFALASASAQGRPSVRMVLLKDWGPQGFVFYTHRDSRKGRELEANAWAAMLFHWKSLRRQVRIEGPVSLTSEAEADAYFATRPRLAQIGAWASLQSQPLDGRLAFEKRLAAYGAKYAVGTVPRPPRWSGFRIHAEAMEFWQDRKFRLHDRVLFRDMDGKWAGQRLYP
ncbi:MAG: pyridoxamine 5'-phosphate oxidase [Pseudomonadota bacterium]